MSEEYLFINRALWDERTGINYRSAFYDVDGFRAGGAATWHDISTSRSVSFPDAETLKSNYGALTTQGFGELGYGIQMGGFAIEPFGNLAYVNLETDSFRERGGDAVVVGGDPDLARAGSQRASRDVQHERLTAEQAQRFTRQAAGGVARRDGDDEIGRTGIHAVFAPDPRPSR